MRWDIWRERGRVCKRVGMLATVLVGLSIAQELYAVDTLLVANKGVPVADGLSASDVQDIFLGKKTEIGGVRVSFVTLKGGEIHDAFLEQYVKRTSSQFMAYWKKQVFSGAGKQPRAFDSDAEAAAFIVQTDGALTYVSPAVYEANKANLMVVTIK